MIEFERDHYPDDELDPALKLGHFLEVFPSGRITAFGEDVDDNGPVADALRRWANYRSEDTRS